MMLKNIVLAAVVAGFVSTAALRADEQVQPAQEAPVATEEKETKKNDQQPAPAQAEEVAAQDDEAQN